MPSTDRLQQDLAYVASAVRHRDTRMGVPQIYFLWAVIVLAGFPLSDFRPQASGPFWLVAGIGGGLLSWWLGMRESQRQGIRDQALGRRYGLHWTLAGVGFFLGALPMIVGRVEPGIGAANFLLVGGLVYALAGVHLERPLLWSGLLMLAAYVVLVLFSPPLVWTATGVVIAIALAWAGLGARRQRATDC